MKRILILAIGIITLFSSCYDEQMEFFPTDQITPDKVFGNEEAAEAALLGVYARFSPGWYKYYVLNMEVYGNKDFAPSPGNDLYAIYSTHIMNPANSGVYKSYKRLFAIVIYANNYLANIGETVFENPERKAQTIGEAKFLRALAYFQLAQLWGGAVPLVTEANSSEMYPASSNPGEEPVKIYQQIISDLNDAIDVLPLDYSESGEVARATKGAAQGILAKALMSAPSSLKDVAQAVDLCGEIINSGKYSLVKNYDDLWNIDNSANSEQIFSAALSEQGSANGVDFPIYAKTGDYRPTQEFYDSFDDLVVGTDTILDVRRDVTLDYNKMSHLILDNKYAGRSSAGTNHNAPNIYVLRYSDVLLLRAEGLNKLDYNANRDEIISLINEVRERAGAVLATAEECKDQETTALVIEQERHKELFFEFQEFYDLKRNGRLIEVLGKNGANLGLDNDYQLLWPLPDSEINKNPNLKQNKGY